MIAAPIMIIGGIIMAVRKDAGCRGDRRGACRVHRRHRHGRGEGPAALPVHPEADRPDQPGAAEGLTGIRVIRAFDRVGDEEKRFEEANLDLTGVALQATAVRRS